MSGKKSGVDTSPIAVTSRGRLLLNVQGIEGQLDPRLLLEQALKLGSSIFIGVEMTDAETDRILRNVDDALFEAAALTIGRRRSRKR